MKKELKDFDYDYQAYANYLESAECANDEGYDVYVDATTGDIYERIDGDWTKGHSHINTKTGYNRSVTNEKSQNRPWENRWLKYIDKLNLTEEEFNFINKICDLDESKNENITLSKRK